MTVIEGLKSAPGRLHGYAQHTHARGVRHFLRNRARKAVLLREEATAPHLKSMLVRTAYGPLSAANVPTLLPPKVLDDQNRTIRREYGTLSLPPQLQFVLEDNWDALIKGDLSKAPPQLADYARWHIGNENLSNEEALKALASDVQRVGNAPRIAQGFLRLAIALDSREMAEVAKTRIAKFFLDGFGLRQSAADMDGMKATMLPLIIQDGLPDLAQAVIRTGGGANDLIKAIYGQGADNYAEDWISSSVDESRRNRTRLGIDGTAVVGGISLGALITSFFPEHLGSTE